VLIGIGDDGTDVFDGGEGEEFHAHGRGGQAGTEPGVDEVTKGAEKAEGGYFIPHLTERISQRARSPAHRAHRADEVFGSVASVRNSVRSVKKEFLQKV
jgi:hypothetical protein